MKVIKGKHKGRTGTIHQFANDWMTVDLDGGPRAVVVGPNQVQLTTEQERERFTTPNSHAGAFFAMWRLREDGTFIAQR